MFDHVTCSLRYFIYRLQVGSLQTLQWLSTILGMIGSICCEDLCIVNVTLRQPLPKTQKKAAMRQNVQADIWKITFVWWIFEESQTTDSTNVRAHGEEDRPSCHRMKEWNGMKRFCMFLHCLILNHLQQIVTLFTLAIKRRRIPVWREACMSRCISCRVLEVYLVVDMFACVQVVPFRIYQQIVRRQTARLLLWYYMGHVWEGWRGDTF